LTFQNSKCLTDAEIRSVFEPAGGVLECDGAVSGPSEGWVMVSMKSQEMPIQQCACSKSSITQLVKACGL